MMELIISDEIINRVESIVKWHGEQLKIKNTDILLLPEKDRWKKWDNNRVWCTFYFSIISPGGSKNARAYLKLVENNEIEFELNPIELSDMKKNERILAIWNFGTGRNIIHKRLGRFFSKPDNIGREGSLEFCLNETFENLNDKGFLSWFEEIEKLESERLKAMQLEFLPGSKFKVSRDFLNNIGMTDSLIPLDVHVLSEMRNKWGWNVSKATPSNRNTYEQIEDTVCKIADIIKSRVVEIDKAIVSYRIAGKEQ
jgi:hypothetical protein